MSERTKKIFFWIWMSVIVAINEILWVGAVERFIDGTFGIWDVTTICGGPCCLLLMFMVRSAPTWFKKEDTDMWKFSPFEDYVFKLLVSFGIAICGGMSMFFLLSAYYLSNDYHYRQTLRKQTFAELVK